MSFRSTPRFFLVFLLWLQVSGLLHAGNMPRTLLHELYGTQCEGIGEVVYVSAAATGGNNGSDWENAFNDLQDALAAARDCEGVREIWVAEGRYVPHNVDRGASFELLEGIDMYGGFVGTETDRQEANPTVNTTTLSGNITGDGNPANNSYHVLFAENITTATTLSGFVVESGYASGGELRETQGGGLWAGNANLQISACTFQACTSLAMGGGIFQQGGSMVLKGTVFKGNNATGSGGAIYSEAASLQIADTEITENSSESNGGSVALIRPTSVWIYNAILQQNNATGDGGAIYLEEGGSFQLVNSKLMWNTASSFGGSLAGASATPEIINCTFVQNSAALGGAISGATLPNLLPNATTVRNSVFWDNTASNFENHLDAGTNEETFSVEYTLLTGGYPGDGNVDDEPFFLEYPDRNAGQVGNLRLDEQSLGIDAGNNAFLPADVADVDGDQDVSETLPIDLAGKARVFNTTVDMGAYEFTNGEPPQSMTLSPDTVPENQPENTFIGTITVEDPDDDEGFVFELVPGHPDNAFFKLAGDLLVTAVPFNFEVRSEYTILVRVTDPNGNVLEQSLTVTIIDVDDPTTFLQSSDTVTVLEDSGAAEFPGFISEIRDEDTPLGGAFIRFNILQNNREDLFAQAPEITPDGILAFTPAADQFGVAELVYSLTVEDSETPADTFYVAVQPVNDAPVSAPAAAQAVDIADGMATVMLFGVNPGPPNEWGQALNFEVIARPLGPIADLAYNYDPVSQELNITFNPLAEDTVIASVLIKDDGGIENEGVDSLRVEFEIYIFNTLERPIFVAELFTPNGDGNNDFFRLLGGGGVASISFSIFDTKGTEVFQSDDFDLLSNTGWDGKFKGLPQPSGTYFWQIKGRYFNGEAINIEGKQTGTLILVR